MYLLEGDNESDMINLNKLFVTTYFSVKDFVKNVFVIKKLLGIVGTCLNLHFKSIRQLIARLGGIL